MKEPRGQGAGEGAAPAHGRVEPSEGEGEGLGEENAPEGSRWDPGAQVTAAKWGSCRDLQGAKEAPGWREGGLKKTPWVQASLGRPLEMELAGFGSVRGPLPWWPLQA